MLDGHGHGREHALLVLDWAGPSCAQPFLVIFQYLWLQLLTAVEGVVDLSLQIQASRILKTFEVIVSIGCVQGLRGAQGC